MRTANFIIGLSVGLLSSGALYYGNHLFGTMAVLIGLYAAILAWAKDDL